MSEKGGKGFSLATGKGVKSSLKSTPVKDAPLKPLKGKDDSSTKSKKGVQFEEGLRDPKPKFQSKSDKPAAFSPKDDSGKGGKGNKGVHGGKKESQPLELKIEQELPKGAKCIMDCEAVDILQGIQEQMVVLSKDSTIKLPVSFDKGLQYAKRGPHYADPQSVRRVLETLTKYGVSDGEISVIANVCPESSDEAFALVPSLKAKRSRLNEPLKDVLRELIKLKPANM